MQFKAVKMFSGHTLGLAVFFLGSILYAGCGGQSAPLKLESQGPELIHPYMQLAGPGGVPTVIWTTGEPTAGTLTLSRAGADETDFPQLEAGLLHVVPLEGLLPDTEYEYVVNSGNRHSSVHGFRTFPERRADGTSDPFPFVAYGDNRSQPDRHAEVIDRILKGPVPSLVVSSGDLVKSGSDRDRWHEEFLTPAENLFAQVPILLSLGNHDLDLDAPKPRPLAPFWLENFVFPGLPGDPGYGRWFSVDAGGVHFIILDSTDESNEDQLRWLREDLAATNSRDADFRIAIFHHPPYSAGGHDSRMAVRKIWEPLLVQHQVDLVFNGHNHFYQRTWPVAGGQVQAKALPREGADVLLTGSAPIYVVTGGGGAPLYDPRDAPYVAVNARRYHHVMIQYRPGSMS